MSEKHQMPDFSDLIEKAGYNPLVECRHGIPHQSPCQQCDDFWKEITKTQSEIELESELAALRSQAAELQRQLDEQAKQEPFGYIAKYSLTTWGPNASGSIIFSRKPIPECTEPLYALPPNLNAMIEQARAEEREAICKAWIEAHGFDKYGVADAIRARSKTK